MRYAFLGAGLTLAVLAGADSITFGGATHRDVLVRESATMYYVQFPESGEVRSVAKSAASGVEISADAKAREAWSARWKAAQKPAAKLIEAPKSVAASAEAESDVETPRLRLRGNGVTNAEDARSDGRVAYVNLKDVPLSTALDAVLRPLNLDYSTQDGFLFISTPERLAHESFEPMVTRTYNDVVEDTLPKIVLRNPFAATAGNFRGGANGGAGLGNGGGGFGGNGGGFNNGGAGGGFGGNQGFGAGSGFGNQGGGYRDVTAITNISDLFSTIDDRMVGESPVQIGVGYAPAGSRLGR